MCVAHSLTRRFDWSENVLWKDDMKGRAVMVALASEDIILDPIAVHDYLNDDELEPRSYRADEIGHGGRHQQRISGLDIVWFDGVNHAEMFDSAKGWNPLVTILQSYCRMAS
jgi:hypothetical protein